MTTTPACVRTTPPLAVPVESGLRTSTVLATTSPLTWTCVWIGTAWFGSSVFTTVLMRWGWRVGMVMTSLPSGVVSTFEPGA